MKLKMLFILSFVFFTSICFCQKGKTEISDIGLKKNVVYGTLGVDIGEFYGTILGNYERMIIMFPDSFFQSFWLRVGAGPWVWWTDKGINYVSTLSVLMGRRSAHLEVGSGVLFSYNSTEKRFNPLINDRHLAGNLGFRFQKPGGKLVLRAGLGWPEFMYLSLGVCF
jgi:hypothetical protein